MLWKAEVKKILLVNKGVLILLVCLLAKILFLGVFPEMKDPRIALSQKQYDKYLKELYGESTAQKNEWVQMEYAQCLETIEKRETVEAQYANGDISEEAYREYGKALELAYLHKNAAQIFSEKADQFTAQDQELPPSWYLYEYGWQTIFFLQQFPDVFLLVGLLLLSAQCFTMEAAAGMLPVLLSAKSGKQTLFFVKLLALLAVGLVSAAVFSGAEVLMFFTRGWCNDAQAPLYSVSLMTNCQLPLSLGAGYGVALSIRLFASLLFTMVIYGLSVWMKNSINTVFAGMCLLILPLLFGGSVIVFTHSGLLCGARILNILGAETIPAAVPLAAVMGYSVLLAVFAFRRYQRGL